MLLFVKIGTYSTITIIFAETICSGHCRAGGALAASAAITVKKE